MRGQPGVAVRTYGLPATAAADEHGREAAPVDEHQHLPGAAQVTRNGLEQRFAQPLFETQAPHVEDAVAGENGCAGTVGQARVTVAAAADVLERLHRRRGTAEHHRNAEKLPALDRHVPRRVVQTLGLLERAVVFLVDDDDPEVLERRKHRRSRADQDPVPALSATDPGIEALPVGSP